MRCLPPHRDSLFGQALGLLLVFRTQNSYARLSEARALWGRAVYLVREIAQTVSTALLYDHVELEEPRATAARAPPRLDPTTFLLRPVSWDQPCCARATCSAAANPELMGSPHTLRVTGDAATRTGCYLTAFSWELNAKLTGPERKDDVLRVLLPEKEAAWLAEQRSRPLQILRQLRRTLYAQLAAGALPVHVHRKLEEDIKELDLVVGGCERLFSSPVPPTMSRHIVRCLVLWLFALPLLLAGTMNRCATSLWVFVTSYIFVGIEEVGVQVEQPFEIVPMTQLCNVIMANVNEAFEPPPDA